jgi:hypothetical protein
MVGTFKLAYYCERLKVGEDYYSILGFGVSVSNAADYATRKMVNEAGLNIGGAWS